MICLYTLFLNEITNLFLGGYKLNICIIDDEHLALEYLDFLFNKIEGVQVTGKYNSPGDLIDHVQRESIDAVFMDIHMPEIKGIDLAEKLLNIQPSLQIVFVTAYNEYAVKAFELNALDYILKPVQKVRLEITIQRIKESNYIKLNTALESDSDKANYRIKNLGALRFYKENNPIEVKWRTSKAKELFAYFVQNHENTIRKGELTDLMWSNLPWEKAHSQLYSTVYQIRKVTQQIGMPIKISSQDEFYHITIEGVEIQSVKWKRAALDVLRNNNVSAAAYFKLLEAYQGNYLEEIEAAWVLKERHSLRKIWLGLIENLVKHIIYYENPSSYNASKLSALVSSDEEAVMLLNKKLQH